MLPQIGYIRTHGAKPSTVVLKIVGDHPDIVFIIETDAFPKTSPTTLVMNKNFTIRFYEPGRVHRRVDLIMSS